MPPTPPRRIAVVGAGPAGLACALTAAERGHGVTLFEPNEIGGQLNLARKIPGKEEFHGLVAWYKTMLDTSGITVRRQSASLADLTGAAFDHIVIATGVVPRRPGIAGEAAALSYTQVLNGAPVGKSVAVIGAGGIGFDVAEFLTTASGESLAEWQRHWGVGDPATTPGGLEPAHPAPPLRQVWLLQRKAEKPGRGLGKTTGWIHRAALQAKGVRMLGGVTYDRIAPEGLWITRAGQPELLPVDTVVLCSGQLPERDLSTALTTAQIAHHIIGGADVATELDAKRAIDQGTRLALTF